jgi:tetratricopeptide (TPR) repeat protein
MYKQRFRDWQLYKNDCTGLRLSRRAYTGEVAFNVPTLNNEDGGMMTILINTKTFVEVTLPQKLAAVTASLPQLGNASNEFCSLEGSADKGLAPEDIWDAFYYGLTLLRMHDYAGARKAFDRACDSARATLLAPPINMFQRLLIVLGTLRWTGFELYRQSILDYTAKLAFNLLGRHHPTAIILQQLRKGSCLEHAAEAILKCSHDLLKEELGSGHVIVLRCKRFISVILRRQKEYQSSENFIQQAISDSAAHNGFHAEETRGALQRLANLYIHQERYADAETICVEVLSRGFSSAEAQGESLDEISIRTLRNLSCLAWLRGRQYSSLEWAHHEVIAALQRWGPVQIRTILVQAGYTQVEQACSDEACARLFLDLCEPIWSFWGSAKLPGTICRAEESQSRRYCASSRPRSIPPLLALLRPQVDQSEGCDPSRSPLPTELVLCDYRRAREYLEVSTMESSFTKTTRCKIVFRDF